MEAINEIARGWWQWMGSMFWQVSLLILIISGLDVVLRKWAWPQVRYALWLLVLVKLVIPPSWSSPSSIVSQLRPQMPQTIFNRVLEPVDSQRGETYNPSGLSVSPSTTPIETQTTTLPTEETPVSSADQKPSVQPIWQTYAMGIWLFGILSFVGLLIGKMIRLRYWHQLQKERGIPQWFHELLVRVASRMNLQSLPAIVFSDKAVTPAVYGMFRPVMLLPTNYFDDLSEQEAEHVLLHELAHLKRGDLWLHGLCLILQIIYWFNPLMMWVRRQMKHVREICCDLTVASILKEKTLEYRQTLLNTARELLTETVEPGLGLLGVFEEPFRLVTRLKWLEKKSWHNRRLIIGTALGASLLLTVFILPMAGIKPEAAVENNLADKTLFVQKEDESYRLALRIEEQQEQAKRVRDLDLAITIKKTDPLYAVVLPVVGPPDEVEAAIDKLERLLKKAKVKPTGHPFGRYWSNLEKVPYERMSWEVGLPVREGTQVTPPLEIIRIMSQQVASSNIEGIRDTDKVWEKFVDKIEDKGYIPAFPPAVEIWTGETVGEKCWWRTELQMPVFMPDKGYPGLNITTKKSEPMTVLVLPMQGSFAQHTTAIERLNNYVTKNNIDTRGKAIGRYFSNPSNVPPSEYRWEVGYTVEPGTEADAPFKVEYIEGSTVACAEINESPQWELPWTAFIIQSIMDGNLPAGPTMEIWPGGPQKPVESVNKTEMRMPVVNPKEISEKMAQQGEQFGEVVREWGEYFGKTIQQQGEEFGEVMQEWGENLGRQMETEGESYDSLGKASTQLVEKTVDWALEFSKSIMGAFGANVPDVDILFKETEDIFAIILPMKGSYEQHPQALKQLEKYMSAHRIKPKGPPFGQYFDDPDEVLESELDWEVGFPVSRRTKVEKPFETKVVYGDRVAYTYVKGTHENTDMHWVGLIFGLIQKGYVPDGPAMEIWTGNPDKTGKDGPETELRIPVSKDLSSANQDESWDGRSKESNELRAIIESISDEMNRAMIEDDYDTMLKYYTDDVIYKPNYSPIIKGKEAVRKDMKKTLREGIKFHSFSSNIIDLWQCGDMVYEIGTYGMSVTTPKLSQPYADNGKYVNIWQEQSDGSFKVSFTMWNTDINPSNR